jgi:succinate dehydrogenase flavin-adding protein (antitoxin of CptAB toxin-antitoxin module)
MKKGTIINISEIKELFREYCEENNEKFSADKFKAFLDCCEKDFYQWLKDNIKYFETESYSQRKFCAVKNLVK